MSFVKKRYCVFGCVQLGAYMHNFPHPERRPDMFKKWRAVVGDKLKETDPLKIYKNKRICDYHFTLHQKVASHRLMHTAVPSLYLEGVTSTPGISVQLEHNYCITGQPGPSTSGSTCSGSTTVRDHNPNDQELHIRLNPEVDQPSTSQLTTDDKEKSSAHILKKYKASQKEVKNLKTQLRKGKLKELNYKSRIAQAEKALSDKSAFDKVTKNMTLPGKIFTGMQYRHALKKPKGRRYTTEEKILALSIYKKAPKCYGMMSKYFKLPSSKSLKTLLRDIKVGPGVNKSIFEKLEDTVGGLNEEDRLCTLIFDEKEIV